MQVDSKVDYFDEVYYADVMCVLLLFACIFASTFACSWEKGSTWERERDTERAVPQSLKHAVDGVHVLSCLHGSSHQNGETLLC